MPQVSKFKLTGEVKERLDELFSEAMMNIKNKEDLNLFLNEFYTPTEQTMFSKRLAIALLLLKEKDFRSISKMLKVSTATVGRINYWIKHAGRSFKKLMDKILEKEKEIMVIENLFYNFKSTTLTWSRGNWSERRRKLEREHREKADKYVV